MATTHDLIEFDRDDPSRVLTVMDEFAAAGDELGWINIGPSLEDDEAALVPTRSGLAAWFSGRGPTVPMATWTPAVTHGRPRPALIGLEHGTGPNALKRLKEAGVSLPSGWTKRGDHAKHGVVVELPAGVDHRSVVDWLVAAAVILSPVLSLGSRWTAVVHRSH